MAGGWSREDLAELDTNMALRIHLASRLYPPREIMFDVAKRAIAKARKERCSDFLRLPKGVSYRGSVKASVKAIVAHLRLDDLI